MKLQSKMAVRRYFDIGLCIGTRKDVIAMSVDLVVLVVDSLRLVRTTLAYTVSFSRQIKMIKIHNFTTNPKVTSYK